MPSFREDRGAPAPLGGSDSFRQRFEELFETHFPRVFRYLDRSCGESETAADLAQETFVRLFRRGSLPDAPEAWLITVATNLLRNLKSKRSRRMTLLTAARGEALAADAPPSPEGSLEASRQRERVRVALEAVPERDRRLLLLRAEGYAYREIAQALDLNEASVGTLLARARRAFRTAYEGTGHAS